MTIHAYQVWFYYADEGPTRERASVYDASDPQEAATMAERDHGGELLRVRDLDAPDNMEWTALELGANIMNDTLSADDLRDGLQNAPLTMQYLATLIAAKNYIRAGQVLEEQANYVKQFRAALDANRKIA